MFARCKLLQPQHMSWKSLVKRKTNYIIQDSERSYYRMQELQLHFLHFPEFPCIKLKLIINEH